MYKTTRADRNEQWGPVENLGSTINSSSADGVPYISSDGLELYFNSLRTGGYGGADIYVSKRDITNEPWGEPENLGPLVNSEYYDGNPCISPDGLLLFFSDWHKGTPRPGGYGGADIWVTRRASHLAPWETAVNLGPPVNGIAHEIIPRLSPDGLMLYFTTLAGDVWDNWQTPILPIVDLNSDGIVDAVDMCIIVDNWGTDNKLCDIGPMPWGDGVVDVEDLKVLAEHLFEVYPSADTVDIDEADDGGQVELELGKLLVVTLESNPSTGYRWELIENNDVILKQFGEVEFQSSDTSDSPMVGTSGWEIFRFKAVSAGQTTLELVYHRSWEDAEPLKTFSIQVTVP